MFKLFWQTQEHKFTELKKRKKAYENENDYMVIVCSSCNLQYA